MEPIDINPAHWTRNYLSDLGWSETLVDAATVVVDLAVLLVASYIIDFVMRRVVMSAMQRIARRTKNTWDDYFIEQRVVQAVIHIIPLLAIRAFIPMIFDDLPGWIDPLENLTSIAITYQVVITVNRIGRAVASLFESQPRFENKPVRSLLSVAVFLSWFIGILSVISILTGTSMTALMGTLVGTTAVLMLIFQDSIQGLLANFQIAMYDLVRKGDWVTFSKYGVDGDVVSVDLTTVKVQNFNKTISTIPAKAFVNESFVNWRGMESSEVRRIKRHLVIDLESVRFADDALIASLQSVERLKPYLAERRQLIDADNQAKGIDTSLDINGRHMTNIGLFRAYAESYLREHELISKDHSLMVRQLQPTGQGIPLEVYCFFKEIRWVQYEGHVSSLFDHLIASVPTFGLRLYQAPSASLADAILNPQS